MVKNVILKYPNDALLNTYKVCSYKIESLKKNYLLYTLNETEGENVIVYFGELVSKENQLYMESVKSEDLEEFKKFLVSFASGALKKENSAYVETSSDLDQKTIVVTGGSKTKMNASFTDSYFHEIGKETEKEEIEELDFEEDSIEVVPAQEVVENVKEEKEVVEVKETPTEVVNVEQTPEVIVEEPKSEEVKDQTVEVPKKEKKKNPFLKILVVLLILMIIAGCVVGGYFWIKENNRKADANTPDTEDTMKITLEQIGQKIESGNLKQVLSDQGKEVLISTTSSALIFKVTGDINVEYHYGVNGTMLSITLSSDDETAKTLTYHTYAAVQSLLGNDKDKALSYVTSNIDDMTLSKDGIAVEKRTDSWDVQISTTVKADLSVSVLEGPMEESLFESHKEELTTEDSMTLQYNNLVFIKKMSDTLDIIILEKGKLSDDAYQTFLNYLKVALGEEEMNSFKTDYPSFETENKEGTNYTISQNEPLDSSYASLYPSSDYEWVVIQIKKDLLK